MTLTNQNKPRPKLVLFEGLADLGAPLGRRNIDRLERDGIFPRRLRLSAHRIAWVESEVVDWVRAKIASRSEEVGEIGSKPRRRAVRSVKAKKRRAK